MNKTKIKEELMNLGFDEEMSEEYVQNIVETEKKELQVPKELIHDDIVFDVSIIARNTKTGKEIVSRNDSCPSGALVGYALSGILKQIQKAAQRDGWKKSKEA
jgi:hypothetical protein